MHQDAERTCKTIVLLIKLLFSDLNSLFLYDGVYFTLLVYEKRPFTSVTPWRAKQNYAQYIVIDVDGLLAFLN